MTQLTPFNEALEKAKENSIQHWKSYIKYTEKEISITLNQKIHQLEKQVQIEKDFFTHMRNKTDFAIKNWGNGYQKKCILFDLDETLMAPREDTIRIGGVYLIDYLQTTHKDQIIFGICSHREQWNIDQIKKKYDPLFSEKYCLTAREQLHEGAREEYSNEGWEKRSNSYYKKVRTYKNILGIDDNIYPILIDDIIDESFEKKRSGILVPGHLKGYMEIERKYSL